MVRPVGGDGWSIPRADAASTPAEQPCRVDVGAQHRVKKTTLTLRNFSDGTRTNTWTCKGGTQRPHHARQLDAANWIWSVLRIVGCLPAGLFPH